LFILQRPPARALRSTAAWFLLAIPILIVGRFAQDVTGIPQAPLRIREAVQLGFTRIVMPAANVDPDESVVGNCELVGVRTVAEALDCL